MTALLEIYTNKKGGVKLLFKIKEEGKGEFGLGRAYIIWRGV